jgi:hypothetical protein
MIRFHLAAGCLCIALVALAAPATPAAQPDKLIPGDAQLVASINFRSLLNSALFKKYGEEQLKAAINGNPEAKQAFEAMGIDPFKDIDSATVSSNSLTQQDQILVVVRGRYDLDKIQKTLATVAEKDPKIKISKEGERTVYEIKGGDDKPMFANFVDRETLAMSPTKDFLTDAIANAGKKPLNKELLAAIGTIDGNKSVWLAAPITEEMRQQLKNNPQMRLLADKLKAITGTVNITDAAEADLNIHTTDAESATQIGMMLKQFVPLMKVLLQNQEGVPPAAKALIDQLKVNTVQSTVNINLRLTEDMILKLVEQQN